MTKNKSQKKKEAPANNRNVPTSLLTPPATPPANGIVPTPPRKLPNPWERKLIGDFLLEMADKQVISARSGWLVEKQILRRHFEMHLSSLENCGDVRIKLGANGSCNIGALLHRTNFLINTPRGNSQFRIKDYALMDFRKEKFNAIDEKKRQMDLTSVSDNELGVHLQEGNRRITEDHVLDEKAETMPLKYQKTQKVEPRADFELNSFGCFVCQINFDTIEKYEEHVEFHGDESDFQSLKKMEKFPTPMLQLSYQTCVDSHYFGFTLKTHLSDVVIDKFIIVQSRQFYYVYNAHMPLVMAQSGQQRFFVDSHVFMILREQPIVIGFQANGQHYVEQHHFMRTEALPKASFNINPYRLSSKETFRSNGLAPAKPSNQVVSALKHEDAQVRLAEYDKHYRNYCERGRELTQENLGGTLRTLLQVEDIERLQHYLDLKQTKVELHQFGRELSVKMQPNARNINAEDVLSPGDDVLIINERTTQETCSGASVRKLLESNNLILELALKDFDSIIKWARKLDEQFGSLHDKQQPQRHEPRVYFARILGVSTQRVNITCERQLPDNTTYTLIFRPVRAVMRYQYRALQELALTNVQDVQRILFPSDNLLPAAVTRGALQLNNRRIANNPEQMQAVQQIALCQKFPAPYIVFGPPGTGKTATICEAIYQLYVHRPETHILVLAGSNTACDEVALRLLRAIAKAPESQPRPLTRIFAASCDRRIDNIDDLLLEYSNMYALHFYPSVEAVHQYRIVICTLSLAGKLSTGGFARGNVFSHVFVDEAAASTEAEALMGITCTIAPSTNLILSGDHKQLGPVLQSQRASEWGLSLSLFERLFQRKCYQVRPDGGYNEAIQTRLLRNYRSHPEIVSVYNELYYEGKLKAEAPIENVSLVKHWFHTPNENFPIMFHSVFGTVMNTRGSVSLCNNKEIDAVMDYVKDLMYFGINGDKVEQSDIGIISPYKNQYQRIQEQLNMRNWSQIDCGSVELFQGKEKQIIIVSFVRSFTPKLGFLDNQRRLNVLLSRPMSLLILIGNPRTLSQNQDFRSIIEMCRDRKTLVGSPYYPDDLKFQNECRIKPDLGQNLKRTTTKNKASKLFYNKEQLLRLRAESKESKKSELDQIFEELPKVPRYVDNNSEAVRTISSQMAELKMEDKPRPANPKPVPTSVPKPKSIPTTDPIRYINNVPVAIDLTFTPTAPPPPTPPISSRYSYVPAGGSRFENLRPSASEEYRRPPPFYEPNKWHRYEPPPPPPSKKKGCIIS